MALPPDFRCASPGRRRPMREGQGRVTSKVLPRTQVAAPAIAEVPLISRLPGDTPAGGAAQGLQKEQRHGRACDTKSSGTYPGQRQRAATRPRQRTGSCLLPAGAGSGQRAGRRTRISAFRTGLIAGVLILILLVIFIIQNTAAVKVSFFGAHARLPLAIALLIAAIAGALLMAAAGTARITQLRRNIRSTRRARASQLASATDTTRPG